MENLDYNTVAYIRHLLAGKVGNISGSIKLIKEGRTHFNDGKSITEVIERDIEAIKEMVKNNFGIED